MASNFTAIQFSPTLGWWDGPASQAPAGSVTSGAGFWVREGRLMPRHPLNYMGSNYTPLGSGSDVLGAAEYWSSQASLVGGAATIPANNAFPFLFSAATASYFTGSAWTTLGSGYSGSGPGHYWGVSVYNPRDNDNIFVFGGRAVGASVWSGMLANDRTVRSATQIPFGAQDAVAHDHRMLVWNVRPAGSATTRATTRLAWSAYNAPLDWTGPSAGFYDLTDVRGDGTRCFVWGNEVVLATNAELWKAVPTGRGGYEFSPIDRTKGIPYLQAAVATPHGIFWLGADLMLYRYAGGQPEPVGQAIRQTLRRLLRPVQFGDAQSLFGETPTLGWHDAAQQLVLFFNDQRTTASPRVLCSFAYSVPDQVWMPHVHTSAISNGPPLLFPTSANVTRQNVTRVLGMLTSEGNAIAYNASAGPDDTNTATTDAGTLFPMFAEFPIMQNPPMQEKWVNEFRCTAHYASAATVSVNVMSAASSRISSTRTFNITSSGFAAPGGADPVTPSDESRFYVPFSGVAANGFTLRVDVGRADGLSVPGTTTWLSDFYLAGRYMGKAR